MVMESVEFWRGKTIDAQLACDDAQDALNRLRVLAERDKSDRALGYVEEAEGFIGCLRDWFEG